MFTRPFRLIGAVTAVVLATSACGSSRQSATPTATMDPSFLHRLEPVCASDYSGMVNTNKPADAFPYPNFDVEHPDSGLLPKVGAFFAPNVPYWQKIPAQLEALGEPTTNATAWDQVRSIEKDKSTAGIQQIRAAETGDATTFLTTAHRIRSLIPQMTAAENAAGIPSNSVCRNTF